MKHGTQQNVVSFIELRNGKISRPAPIVTLSLNRVRCSARPIEPAPTKKGNIGGIKK